MVYPNEYIVALKAKTKKCPYHFSITKVQLYL